jgi:hypothetical protein
VTKGADAEEFSVSQRNDLYGVISRQSSTVNLPAPTPEPSDLCVFQKINYSARNKQKKNASEHPF